MKGQVLLATAVIALAGCKDSSAPGTVDPSAIGAKVAQAVATVQANKAVQGFDVMSGAFTFAGAAPAAPPAVLPANVLGKTFAYNASTSKYQPNSDTGAPANGVRYLVYAVDTVTRMVISPLQQIGYLDLTDKSSAAANTLGVKAVVGSVTVLEYDANASIAGGGNFSYGAKGNAVDGANRLDFDITLGVPGNGPITVSYKLTAPTLGNLGVEINASASSPTTGTSTLVVTDAADRLEIAMTTTNNNATGMAKFNGSSFANVTAMGNAEPTFSPAGGYTLTDNDRNGLKQLYHIVDQIFNRFDDVLFPSYFVFGLNP